ncbi:uncharacterized protein LOC135464122 [Liolophura sinensis]|uniref:uncharacterized protein LOC135464122 n=1 Tax=Liolophura sinensis TaxID=3198878 RepID=UPI003158A6DD
MSLQHRWILLVKAQCILLLSLQYVYITHCQEAKTSPSGTSVKDVGVTGASNMSPMDTSPASVSRDSGTDAVNQTSTGSPASMTVDIQPTPSASLLTDIPSLQAGETTPVLPSPNSAVLPPLSTVLQSPKPLHNTVHENFQESISSISTDSDFVQGGTELIWTDNVAIVTTSVSESVFYSDLIHIHVTSSSNVELSATTVMPTASISASSSPSSSATIPSTEPNVSNETSSGSVTLSSTSSVTSNSSSSPTSSPVGSSSRDTTPGKPVNTTKLPTNSSNTPGEGDRLHKGQDEGALNTPAIIGIGFGAAATALVVIGLILLLLKRKAYRGNKHNSSNFWDDNVTLSYINSHAEFPKDYDAEMMSLDDDSFLNSLDSMTFANLWAADTAKHTNF